MELLESRVVSNLHNILYQNSLFNHSPTKVKTQKWCYLMKKRLTYLVPISKTTKV